MRFLLEVLSERITSELGFVAELLETDALPKIIGGADFTEQQGVGLYIYKFEIVIQADTYVMQLPSGLDVIETECYTEGEVLEELRDYYSRRYPDVTLLPLIENHHLYRYMPEEIPLWFWQLIEAAQLDPKKLAPLLETLDEERLLHFVWNYTEASRQMIPEIEALLRSEDNAYQACNWIVAQGCEFYRNTWHHLDQIDSTSPIAESPMDPGLYYESIKVYEARFGNELPVKTCDDFYA